MKIAAANPLWAPVGGELTFVPQRRLNDPVTAGIQPGLKSVLSPGFSQVRGQAWRSIGRHPAAYGLGRNRRRTRVMPAIGVWYSPRQWSLQRYLLTPPVRCPRPRGSGSARRAPCACDQAQ